MATRLLVSVRDAAEAVVAAAAGADIIDVKEPDQGSLGFAGTLVIADVLHAVADTCPVSAALGECTDWQKPQLMLPHREPDVTDTSVQLTWVKLGLAGMTGKRVCESALCHSSDGPVTAKPSAGTPGWIEVWQAARRAIPRSCGWSNVLPDRLPTWVAVAYADHVEARCPTPRDVLAAAIASNCAGLLIDTFRKGHGTTLERMSEQELCRLQQSARDNGLFFALAGQLTARDVPVVRRLAPDILAVRGAVCDGHDRRAKINADKVRTLKHALSPEIPIR